MNQQKLASFLSRVEKTETCWLWKGYVDKKRGYGRLGPNWAHRLSYELFKGIIPLGYDVHHTCEKTLCVNPEHLELVLHKKHPGGGAEIKRQQTHCLVGHPFDEKNTYISPNGTRKCRACRAENARNFRRKNSACANSQAVGLTNT